MTLVSHYPLVWLCLCLLVPLDSFIHFIPNSDNFSEPRMRKKGFQRDTNSYKILGRLLARGGRNAREMLTAGKGSTTQLLFLLLAIS